MSMSHTVTVTCCATAARCLGLQIDSPDPVQCSVMLSYEETNHRISLQVQFPSEGCFHAAVSYQGIELHNGDFDIIVLSGKCK
jgi:hypothetical protein